MVECSDSGEVLTDFRGSGACLKDRRSFSRIGTRLKLPSRSVSEEGRRDKGGTIFDNVGKDKGKLEKIT